MRPIPVYNRKKSVRTWEKEGLIQIESFLEDAVHFIILNLKVEKESKKIQEIKVNFFRSPYPELCPSSASPFEKIIGLTIAPGFNKKVSELIPAEQGCTHIRSLLKEAADGFMQSFYYYTAGNLDGLERRKVLIKQLKNNCVAYSEKNV
ncbi:MAG: hypothetical protein A2Y41_04125 [Spirochaetes bacterium GWB1_36_13]|nr:MAG: hypothetical protein A2Y41_04125 [Spirochaetes bacterium GWB1_36_13]